MPKFVFSLKVLCLVVLNISACSNVPAESFPDKLSAQEIPAAVLQAFDALRMQAVASGGAAILMQPGIDYSLNVSDPVSLLAGTHLKFPKEAFPAAVSFAALAIIGTDYPNSAQSYLPVGRAFSLLLIELPSAKVLSPLSELTVSVPVKGETKYQELDFFHLTLASALNPLQNRIDYENELLVAQTKLLEGVFVVVKYNPGWIVYWGNESGNLLCSTEHRFSDVITTSTLFTKDLNSNYRPPYGIDGSIEFEGGVSVVIYGETLDEISPYFVAEMLLRTQNIGFEVVCGGKSLASIQFAEQEHFVKLTWVDDPYDYDCQGNRCFVDDISARITIDARSENGSFFLRGDGVINDFLDVYIHY